MLDLMRKNSKSWIMLLLFGVLVFVFAVNFGPWAGNVGGQLPYAAEVNGRIITLNEFQSAYSAQFREIQRFQPGLTPEQAEAQGFKQIILEQLVSQELLAQLAIEKNLSISDEQLTKEIKVRFFGEDKPFDKEEYSRIVSSYFHMSEGQFEEQLRRELLADKIAEVVATTAYVSDDELKSTYEARNNRVTLEYIRIDPSSFKSPKEASSEEIAAFVKDHEKEIADYYQRNLVSYQAQKKELKDVKEEVAKKLIEDVEQKKQAQAMAKTTLDQLKAGRAPSQKFETTQPFQRDASFVPGIGLSAELVETAFSLTPEKPVAEKVFEVGGGLFVVRLKERQSADMAKFTEEKDRFKNFMLMQRKRQIMQDFVAKLKKNARINYNKQLSASAQP